MECSSWIPTSLPEEQGIPSHAILWFLDQVEREGLDLHSLQIVRNGKMVVDAVAAPYTHNSFHRIYSAAKGMVATAVLFTIQDGYYSLDEKVVPKIPAHWLPEDLDPRWHSLTLYHLLTMNTGHDKDTLFEMWGKSDCWIKTFFQVKPAYEPGTYFCYDMGAQYVMNELVRLATGKDTGQYLQEKLLSKLGIEYQVNYTEPEGLFFSSSIQLKPDALTKLSLFYLQKGCWNGEQLLRPELAEALGAHQTPSRHYEYVRSGQFDNMGGYGLHMWRNPMGGYRFAGGQGQLGIVVPDDNLVVGMMAGEHRSNRLLDLIFEALWSEMYTRPVKVDEDDRRELERRLAQFNLAPREVSDRSSRAGQVSGNTYHMRENETRTEQVSFVFREDCVEIHTLQDGREKLHLCGLNGQWLENTQGYLMMQSSPDQIQDLDRIFAYDTNTVLLSGGWRATDTFEFSLRSASLLCEYRFQCRFVEDELIITRPYNDYLPRTEIRHPKFIDPKKKLRGQLAPA